MPFALLVGLGAGLVSAVLFASASTGTILGLFVLFLLSPLPVAIAGLGWGWTIATVAAAAGSALIAIAGSPRAAILYVLALGLPTVVLVYLTLLNRTVSAALPGTESGIVWYPLGRIVTVAALWAGSLGALALAVTASDIEGLRAVLRAIFERVFINAEVVPRVGERGIGESEVAAFTELMVVSYSSAVAIMWLALACLNVWLAGIVTRASGRLARPWPDLSALTLPRSLPVAFALAIGLTFLLPPYVGLMASGFASAFLFAFMLVGLAIIHNITRGHGLRPAILVAVYVALVVFNPLSSFILGMVGLAEPFSPLRRRPPPPSPPPPTT